MSTMAHRLPPWKTIGLQPAASWARGHWVILDGPLVYSDDGRLDTMIEILSEVATRMQAILLTCRDRAFRHVPGNRLVMETS